MQIGLRLSLHTHTHTHTFLQQGNRLTDKKLFQTILLAITPEFILLILSTTIGFTEEDFSTTLRFDRVNITREPVRLSVHTAIELCILNRLSFVSILSYAIIA